MSKLKTREDRERANEEKRKHFLQRLAGVREADPLWEMMLWVIGRNIDAELEVMGAPSLGDEGAHRQRGRLSMLLDLREQLEDSLEEARRPPES